MNKTIKYKIKFFSDWHCGSGLSSGADLDLLVIKDKDRLPFIPGKTIKGLVREAIEEIAILRNQDIHSGDIINVFGKKNGESQGCAFFKNAVLDVSLQKAITGNKLQDYLYRSLSSTAIDNEGIAKEHSLRKMEVCVPCKLTGEILIYDVHKLNDKDFVDKQIKEGLKFIKRLGQNRNRGLGRCEISQIIIEEGGSK